MGGYLDDTFKSLSFEDIEGILSEQKAKRERHGGWY